MTYRLRNIGIAVALAIVAVLLVLFYLSDYKRTLANGQDQISVYVAKQDIPAGTSGAEALDQGMLEKKKIDRDTLAPGWIASENQVKTLSAKQTVYTGQQATTQLFRSEQQRGIRAQITGNLRALAVPGAKAQLLADVVRAGDHVDVVGSWNVPEGEQRHFSRVLLRNLLVLDGAHQSGDSKLTNPNEQLSSMVALTDVQAEKLFWIMKNGEWSFQLRPVDDAVDSPESAASSETLLFDGLQNTGQYRKLMAAGRSNR